MTVSAARTLVLPAGTNPALAAGVLAPPLRWPMAQPGVALDYSLDLTAPLADIEDSLSTVSVDVTPSGAGELVVEAVNVDGAGSVVTVTLSGGVPGRSYAVRFIVTTRGGEIPSWTVGLLINPALAVFPLPSPPSLGPSSPVTWQLGQTLISAPGVLSQPVQDNLTAGGTDLATAPVMEALVNIFTTVPAGAGARLNQAIGNGTQRVVNATATDLPIYPPSTGAEINSLGAGVPAIVSAFSTADFSTQAPNSKWRS